MNFASNLPSNPFGIQQTNKNIHKKEKKHIIKISKPIQFEKVKYDKIDKIDKKKDKLLKKKMAKALTDNVNEDEKEGGINDNDNDNDDVPPEFESFLKSHYHKKDDEDTNYKEEYQKLKKIVDDKKVPLFHKNIAYKQGEEDKEYDLLTNQLDTLNKKYENYTNTWENTTNPTYNLSYNDINDLFKVFDEIDKIKDNNYTEIKQKHKKSPFSKQINQYIQKNNNKRNNARNRFLEIQNVITNDYKKKDEKYIKKINEFKNKLKQELLPIKQYPNFKSTNKKIKQGDKKIQKMMIDEGYFDKLYFSVKDQFSSEEERQLDQLGLIQVIEDDFNNEVMSWDKSKPITKQQIQELKNRLLVNKKKNQKNKYINNNEFDDLINKCISDETNFDKIQEKFLHAIQKIKDFKPKDDKDDKDDNKLIKKEIKKKYHEIEESNNLNELYPKIDKKTEFTKCKKLFAQLRNKLLKNDELKGDTFINEIDNIKLIKNKSIVNKIIGNNEFLQNIKKISTKNIKGDKINNEQVENIFNEIDEYIDKVNTDWVNYNSKGKKKKGKKKKIDVKPDKKPPRKKSSDDDDDNDDYKNNRKEKLFSRTPKKGENTQDITDDKTNESPNKRGGMRNRGGAYRKISYDRYTQYTPHKKEDKKLDFNQLDEIKFEPIKNNRMEALNKELEAMKNKNIQISDNLEKNKKIIDQLHTNNNIKEDKLQENQNLSNEQKQKLEKKISDNVELIEKYKQKEIKLEEDKKNLEEQNKKIQIEHNVKTNQLNQKNKDFDAINEEVKKNKNIMDEQKKLIEKNNKIIEDLQHQNNLIEEQKKQIQLDNLEQSSDENIILNQAIQLKDQQFAINNQAKLRLEKEIEDIKYERQKYQNINKELEEYKVKNKELIIEKDKLNVMSIEHLNKNQEQSNLIENLQTNLQVNNLNNQHIINGLNNQLSYLQENNTNLQNYYNIMQGERD
ncbi:hypothetical protein HN451_05300, partial [archaeon]|nr:hypothetical protein [archaeon]